MMDCDKWLEFYTCAFIPALIAFGLYMTWKIKKRHVHDTGTGKKHTRTALKGH